MATKLYPPKLEGTLPAFYKSYNKKGDLQGATITIPFGRNPAVNRLEVDTVTLRLRTVSTNSYIITDLEATSCNMDECLATFLLPNDSDFVNKISEGQYYRAQLAFKSHDGIIGYYSTVGIIKCIAKPQVSIKDFEDGIVNSFKNTSCIGVYLQNTQFGDTTEKVYSYNFKMWDEEGVEYPICEEKLHDATQDVASDWSNDICEIFINLQVGKIYLIQYIVTTLNGLVIPSPKYKMMKTTSVDPEFPIHLYCEVNLDEGYTELTLEGDKIERKNYDGTYVQVPEEVNFSLDTPFYILNDKGLYVDFEGTRSEWLRLKNSTSDNPQDHVYMITGATTSLVEATSNSVFRITRSSSEDGFFRWQEVVRFVLSTGYPSDYSFKDFTIQQGITYHYAILQYNIYGVYSNRIIGVDKNDNNNIDIVADFEDMFLYDGERQLKIRFNPHVKSFKETIPELKIETIGSKYPYIFRNGVVNYKEFPIDGLISYQEDEALLFLTQTEAEQAGILEIDWARPFNQKQLQELDKAIDSDSNYNFKLKTPNSTFTDRQWVSVRTDKNLTSKNIMGERYFKLKVLDWLNDGRVKLFRSPTEGAYLVRLMNVSFTPEDTVGRMLHNFTCTGYEIAELNYDNLVSFGIVHPNDPTLYESHWGVADVNRDFTKEPDEDGFYQITLDSTAITGIEITDFAPGDILRITYDTADDPIEIVVGVTGSLKLNGDARTIVGIEIKPNPLTDDYDDFSRSLIYTFTGTQLSAFDAIKDVNITNIIAELYIGPQENVFEHYLLRDHVYGHKDAATGLTPVRITTQDGYDDLYNDLISHKHISYDITDNASKFTGYKIDILQVHKRDIIPIFARDQAITDNTIFDVTPFGLPYIPTSFKNEEDEEAIHGTYDISNFIVNGNINYAYGDVLNVNPYEYYGGVNVHDIYPLLQLHNPNINYFVIFEAWVKGNDGKWKPSETHRYFDTYTNEWWNSGEKYDPTFSFNDDDNDEEIVIDENSLVIYGDSNIRLSEINDLTLYNLGMVKNLRLGNGVMAEITFSLRVVDYDIEEAEPVKGLKEDYLKKKEDYFNSLLIMAEGADKIADALIEEAQVQALLDLNAEQLKKYTGATTAIDAVLAVLRLRMQDLKIKLYDTARERYETIEALLKGLDAPLDENNTQDFRRALDDAIVYVEEVKDENGETLHPINEYQDRESNERTIERYGFSTTPDEHIEWNYIYKPQYQAIVDENTELVNRDNEEIAIREKLIGNKNGYFSDVLNDEPAEGTIIYYDKLIANQEALIETLTNKYNEELEKLNDELLNVKKAILYATISTEQDAKIDLFTDLYILDNVEALKKRLEVLISACNLDLADLDGRYLADLKDLLPKYIAIDLNNDGQISVSEDEINNAKILAVKDYLAEYTAITSEHSDDADWLSSHFKEMMDNYMVIVKKEE